MDTAVRLADARDEEGVLMLCRELANENAVFPISETKVREKLWRAFNRQLAICGVIGDVGDLKACIFLEIDCPWYSDKFGLSELWNFVHPDHRRSDYAKILIDFAKKCAVDLNLPLQIGIFSNERTEAKVRLYARRLGKPAGAFFLYNGHTGLR